METNRRDVEEWFNAQVRGDQTSQKQYADISRSLSACPASLQNAWNLCVSDGGTEPASSDQLSTTAMLPEGHHRTETYHECPRG